MGKRKYDNDSQTKTKKKKNEDSTVNDNISDTSDQPQNVQTETKGSIASSTKHIFDIKHFRKELNERQGQTMALTQFLQVCLNPDCEIDFLLEYLKTGGNSHEILRQISQDNKKNLTLATPVFHLFHLIILKVQSSLPHMITITEEACRYFLNTFAPTVEIMISENSGPRHRKIILKLLTSIVTLNSDLGIEVLNQIPLTPKNLQYITEKANYKEKDNVRTSFVHFITSFLVDGHLPLIKALLEKQGLLPLVIPGLIHDEPEAVLMFLNILKKNVIDNILISKTLKLKTFSQQVLHNLFKVFFWKGPPEMASDHKKDYHDEIMKTLSDIILTLYTSHKHGLYFVDKTLGVSDANRNQNLYKSLLSLKRPWENKYQSDILLEIIHTCPDLHRAVVNIIEQSFQPQHSPIWEKTVLFIERLLDKLKPEDLVPKLCKLNAQQSANFIRFVTLPVPILKIIQANIGKDQAISIYCVKVLVKMLQSLKRFMQILEFEDENDKIIELKTKLENFLPKHLPQTNVIVSLVNDVIKGSNSAENPQDYSLPKINNADALLKLIDLILLINYIQPSYVESIEGFIEMKKILDYTMTLTEGPISLLKFKIVSLWLMLDPSVLTLQSPIFKKVFLIMLEVYTNQEDDTWREAKETMHMFLKNTEIFEADEDEIYLMLYTLRITKLSNISLIADVYEHILTNVKEISEYIRNQAINFEISDENNKADLDKLLSDLMNARKCDSNLFIENKTPSPFIVGCVQFLQNNKEAKKYLKHFVGLYVVNLLHWNYSPELTEILIGDLKLDVKSYVANWLITPISLSETTCNDEILLNISKAIIENKDITLDNIFPMIKSTEDATDLNIELKEISSSDLFVWAKYLFYCVVRLTAMDKLNEDYILKIERYLEVIISLGKKNHMTDVLRNIMLNFLKNAHIFKIYCPVDFNKTSSNIKATNLILNIIENNKDIISYVNKKYYVLKFYQEKNCNEIIKAFIKIKKRKIVNSEHTIKAMKIIGTTKEGDVQIFDYIFSTEISSYMKNDKETSLVLDLLCELLEKYSQLALDLPPDVLQKSLNIYTSLLTNKELIPNLTNLELALITYFEYKPHHIAQVSGEVFKNFFYANNVRKTTSQLASVILKFNKKLCDVFKDEICRPEIMSLRELTLPLSNAVVHHNDFIIETKDILTKIYQEYKSNITKYLEKPHKVGQIYISSSKLIQKLIVECMTVQDCQRIFSKSYKYEIVELGHVSLIQTAFLKLCLHSEGYEKQAFINYFSALLHLASNALKENINEELVSVILSNINNVIKIYRVNDELETDKKDFQKVTESGIWHGFCKIVLKDALKVKTTDQENATGPKKMAVLTALVKLFYSEDHTDIVTLFDMVTSHSEFLNVMLSYHSPDIKFRLLEFLLTLLSINKSVMKAQQIPVYLSAYRATRSPCDRLILTILQFYESNDMPVNEYKPYVFGDSAANFYAVRKNRNSSLWGHPSPNQVINLFDREIIDATIRHFPVDQKLVYTFKSSENSLVKNYVLKRCNSKIKDVEAAVKNLTMKDEQVNVLREIKEVDLTTLSHVGRNENIYDPAFLYPLLSHLLAPGSVASCFKLLRSGLLSVAVMGLSSHCPLMRAAAFHVLHRFFLLLETDTRHKNDKLLLTDFMTTLKQSLVTAINAPSNGVLTDLKNPRLPAIGALYLARALMVSTSPTEPLYKPVNNFLIAKQFVDLTVVPDFLSLFHDSDVETAERRTWILDIIKDGTKTMSDVNVVFKTMCLKMIMDFYSTVLCDKKTKVNILNTLNSIISVPRGFEILTEGYGFLSWMHFVVCELNRDSSLIKAIIALIENMIYSLNINVFVKHCAKIGDKFEYLTEFKVKSDTEFEILNLLCGMLPKVDCLEDDIVEYVKLFNRITKRSIKFLTKKQMTNVVSKCSLHLKDSESAKLLNEAVNFNNCIMLCSRTLIDKSIDDILCKELKTLANTYLT